MAVDQTRLHEILQIIQIEQKAWELENFGDQPAHLALIGLNEEFCEFIEAHTVVHHSEQAKSDAVCDMTIYLISYCNKIGVDLAFLYSMMTLNRSGPTMYFEKAIGLLNRYHLKNTQGIRTEMIKNHLGEGLQRFLRYLGIFLSKTQDREETLIMVWNKVKNRNWKENKESGGE